jgi:exodeoxyribonuclease-1
MFLASLVKTIRYAQARNLIKQIERKVASRILSTNKQKWWTVSAFYSELDEIRENESKMFSFKNTEEKLDFLEGINQYVMDLEKRYSNI